MQHFITTIDAEDPADAFLQASHADMVNYPPTGLALKSAFRQIETAPGEDPYVIANQLTEDQSSPFYGAAAPAGCVPVGEGKFIFFGWRKLSPDC